MLKQELFAISFFLVALFVTAQTPCENSFAGIYPCSGYDLCSYTSLEDLGGGVKGNDCWGWVDEVSGREFVIYGRTSGTSFVEITDPYSPVYLAELPPPIAPSIWRDMKVIENYVYIVTESGGGIQIVELTQLLDISGPTVEIAPTILYDVVSLAHNIAINTESEYAYIIGNALDVLDVSAPESPELVSSYDEYGSHDIHSVIYHGPDEDYFGMEILFSLAYDALEILNADDKTDIQLISQVADSSNSVIHQGWTDENHRWLYYNDEADEINDSLNTRTFIVDIEDLDNPAIVGFYEHDTQSTDHNLYVSNGKVYASNNSSGLRVLTIEVDGGLDMSGFFDTYPENDSAGYVGVWSSYPYFPSKNIALSDRGGLFIIRESAYSVEPVGSEKSQLMLLPNPATYSVEIKGDFYNCSVVVCEMTGRRVLSTSEIPSVNGLNLDISGFKEGGYILNMINSDGRIEGTGKLIVGEK